MKKSIIISALGAMLMASCADEFDQSYTVGRPDMEAEYGYLKDYAPLKDNVDRSKYPNFKVGAGTTVADFLKKELVYALTKSNFDETVAGNAMKMASCVNDKGEMNFGTVSEYVSTAADAGISVYGHTLAWHAQQPVKWLNTLIADKPAPVLEADPCIVFNNGDAGANQWDKQGIYTLPTPMVQGKTYIVKASVKTDDDYADVFGLWPIWDASPNKNQWGGSNDVQYLATYSTSKTFTDYTWEFQASFPHDKLQFVFGKVGGKVYIDNVSCMEKGTDTEMIVNGKFDENSTDGWSANWGGPTFAIEGQAAGPVEYEEEVITNGDMEGTDASSFWSKEPPSSATVHPTIVDGVGVDGTRGVVVKSADNPAQDWDCQFWIQTPEPLAAGTKIHVQFDYKANKEGDADTQAHGLTPGAYQHWACIGSPHFTTEWQHWDATVVVDASMAGENGMQNIAFNLSKNKVATEFYFDNISILQTKTSSSGGIPQTPEEILDTLTYAMDVWISGMMDACKDENGEVLVKGWDVVNEPLSGGNADGEGVYALQHLKDQQDPAKAAKDNFFWQDYMGDLEYVRTAVAKARQYGGNDLKLFINDYNLESDWDDNGKLKSLIKWIERWEADGVTKIDGIGSQMHISCYANAQTQASKKNAIVNMLKLMAQSGKLVRISELDMGFVDASGNSVKTDNMTEEQHHMMADLYQFIIEKYFEIIPVNQQWGICQWCTTDAPASSGWRGGEPVGLWDLNYNRKHTYAGFADGLSGK